MSDAKFFRLESKHGLSSDGVNEVGSIIVDWIPLDVETLACTLAG